MRRKATFLFLIIIAGGVLAGASAGERALFAPMQPSRGTVLSIAYDPAGTPLQSAESALAEVLVVRETDTPVLRTVPLGRDAGQWSGSVRIPEVDVTLLLVQFVADDRVDDNDGNAWLLMVHNQDGKPVRGAHLARATVLQRAEYFNFRHERDTDGMQRALALEQALYPENWRASIMSWGLLMRSPGGEEAAQIVKRQLDTVYARENGHQATVAELLPWFEQSGQIDRAERIRSAAIAEDPQGPVAMATARSSVSQERDPAARLEKAREVLGLYPWSDRDYDALVALQVSAHTRLGQYEEAARTARSSRHPSGSLYNSIAWPLVEKGERLAEAVEWARTGVDLIRAQSEADRPAYLSERSWRSSRAMQLGMILDTYALGLFKMGRFREAEGAYAEADSLFDGAVAETAERLAETYLKNGKAAEALEVARRMILTGTTTDSTLSVYREAYITHSGSAASMDQDLQQLRSAAADRLKAELLRTRMATPAPVFALQSLDGSTVSLEKLRGRVVILDFWATWCGPCKMSFPYLQRFYDRHRENDAIAPFAVNTWEREQGEKRQRTVRKFLADNRYTFPVLFDETAVEQYGVEGIPTRFVIDQEGMIRFKSVGFEGGEKMLTQMGLQIELLLEDLPPSSR